MKLSGHVFAVVVGLVVSGGTAHAEIITIPRAVPYADSADIARNIKEECADLQTKLANFIQESGVKLGVGIQFSDDPSINSGKVLQIEIYDVVSSGNPFMGHFKLTKVRGTLMENGQKIASFKAMRQSRGGAFAQYKGSCSVLGRTVRTLGQDIGTWLANPKDGAELGDL